MTKPTPCKHEWIRRSVIGAVASNVTRSCSKCGELEITLDDGLLQRKWVGVKPTPEEKCNHRYHIDGCPSCEKIFQDSISVHKKFKPSPSPEAKCDGLKINCDNCGAMLREPGALMFSPPDSDGRVDKIHWCKECWRNGEMNADEVKS